METFDFIKDDYLLEELDQLKEEDPEFYDEVVKYVRRNRNMDINYLTNFIIYAVCGE